MSGSSFSTPRKITLKAGSAISRGDILKFGADDDHVVPSAAATDKHMGIAADDAAAAEDLVEIQLPGGGGLVKSGATIARGDLLSSDASGNAIVALATHRTIGLAMQSSVANDLMPMEVSAGIHT